MDHADAMLRMILPPSPESLSYFLEPPSINWKVVTWLRGPEGWDHRFGPNIWPKSSSNRCWCEFDREQSWCMSQCCLRSSSWSWRFYLQISLWRGWRRGCPRCWSLSWRSCHTGRCCDWAVVGKRGRARMRSKRFWSSFFNIIDKIIWVLESIWHL